MPVYSVSQITRYLKESLEADSLLNDLWLRGEVSNLTRSAAGHYYFTLKDATSQVRCVMFRPAYGGEHLAEGAAVIAHGRVSIYEVRGDLQLIADLAQPEGVGELHLELERLKMKLEAEGLFQVSRKRPLPEFPKRIGVATSPTGAVWHDIQNVLRRRYPLVELAFAPTPVQGDTAAAGIVDAFDAFNAEDDLDLVILARGGGSLEDLWPFNEEAVARAIYASRAPVISAVGHETDYTIADMVADCRAPTPSAAAELAAPDMDELMERIESRQRYIFQWVSGDLSDRSRDLRSNLLQAGAPHPGRPFVEAAGGRPLPSQRPGPGLLPGPARRARRRAGDAAGDTQPRRRAGQGLRSRGAAGHPGACHVG